MASNQDVTDLHKLSDMIQSGCLDPHTISFSSSQLTSSCYQETQNSIKVHISQDGFSQFSQLLTALATAKNRAQSSLKHVEFHMVEWEREQARDLRVILENTPSLRQIVFRKNKFSAECLLEIIESLRNNKRIKEVMLSESCIGSDGARMLASVLKDNDCLEELQIWEDSIGSKGAEELSNMIEVNSTLKLLIVFDSKATTATPIISAVLARNRPMETHVWSVDGKQKSSKIVEFVPENGTLRIYRLDVAGACRVTCALGLNLTVKSLDMTGVKLNSRWAKEFRHVLEQNRSLKEVNLSGTCLKNKGIVYISAGLFKNQSLERLHLDGNCFGAIGVEHLLCPLSKYSPLQFQANTTLKSLTFGGRKTKIGRGGLAAITQLLTSNQSVTHLGLHDDESLRASDMVKIFESLERNATLKSISLQGCKGVKGEALLKTIMETLKVNPWIEDIDLARTPLEISGKTEEISARLSQNDRVESDVDLLKNMPMTVPRSCRVFLCGQEFAGKSTLCDSISQNFSTSRMPYSDPVRMLVNPIEQAVRTPGMRVKVCQDEDTKISIWNLAAEHEFCSFHELMFPGHGSASLFLVITSLFSKPNSREPKSPGEIEEDIVYWLRFIVSSSKRAVQQCNQPCVTVVLTHFDKINQLPCGNLEETVSLIQRLKDRFHGFVEFHPTVFTVDTRSTASVSKLSYHLRKASKTVLEKAPRVYQLCNDLTEMLSEWRVQNRNRPTMKWKEFGDLCQIKVPSLRIRSRHGNTEKVETRRRAVATCLHQVGEVIFFDECEFLILDCEWFCSEVLSQIIRLDARKLSITGKNGLVSRKELEKFLVGSMQSHFPGMGSKVLENMEASDLVTTMLKFELCFEQDPSDSNSLLLIPSSLEEGRWKPQKWQVNALDSNYVGRHLHCDESSHIFLTPAVFPRLQVRLSDKIKRMKNQNGGSYSLEKHLISINLNGIYIRIELGGKLGYYIDVLACSSKSPSEMLRLLKQLIIPEIQSLCHGIVLTECIIRSDCVKNLTPPRHRRNQSVALQRLKQALLSLPAEDIYDYQHTWDSCSAVGPGFDFARDLLSDDEFREVLHSRYHDLYNLAMELQAPEESSLSHPQTTANEEIASSVEPTFAGLARGVEAVLQRLKIIEQEIRDVKQEIQGLKYYEQRLLLELHRKVDYFVNYNVQLEERRVPNMFYFVRTENYSRRLITTLISGMNALRMHMLCEYRREMHVVEDQMGCELIHVDNITMRSLAPFMKKFMSLLTFALKIGAHLAIGMGPLIPDLGREIAHLVDSSTMYGAAGAAAGTGAAAAAAAMGNRSRESREAQQDLNVARQWVVDFLREHGCSSGKEIGEKFGLWRVRYRDDGRIAWICRRHICTRGNEVIEVPV